MIWIQNAEYLQDYNVRIYFNNGAAYTVNLAEHLEGEVFKPLKTPVEFAKLRYDPNTETICWDCGADFAPEFLYELALQQNPGKPLVTKRDTIPNSLKDISAVGKKGRPT